jgi:ribose transport system substrate-binding protein
MTPPQVAHRSVALAAGLALALTGCSLFSKAPTGTQKVGFSVPNTQLNFSIEMIEGFRSGVRAVGGVEDVVVGPPIVDGAQQVQQFQALMRDTPAGISVFTLSPELFVAPLSTAAGNGIPLIAVDNPPPAASKVPLFVGNDNHQLGELLADEAVKLLAPDATGTIIIGTSSPGVPVLDHRATGIRDGIRRQRPAITVLGPFDTKQDVPANLAAWQALVRANPRALAFLGTGDADGFNLARIRQETQGTFVAGAFDLETDSLAAVKRGDLVLVSPEHFVKGAVAGRLQARRAKEGEALPEGWLYTPGLAVTPANIDEIMARQASPEAKGAWFAHHVETILTDGSYLRPMDQVT